MAYQSTWGPYSLGNNGNSSENILNRSVIPSSQLTASGSTVRITLKSRSGNYQISDVYIGHVGTSGTAWDFDGNQVRVTFGGGGTGSWVSAGVDVQSDGVAFNLDKSKNLIISLYGTAANDTWPYSPSLTGCTNYTLAGTAACGSCGSSHSATMTPQASVVVCVSEVDVDQSQGVNATLPMITIKSISGNYLNQPAYVDFYPYLTAHAGGSQNAEVSTDATLHPAFPMLGIYSVSGGVFNTPYPELILSALSHLNIIGEIVDTLPVIQISAHGYLTNVFGEVNGLITAWYLNAHGFDSQNAEVNRILPPVQISADILQGYNAEVNMTFEPIQITADCYWLKGGIVNAIIPAIIPNYIKALGIITMVVLNTKNLAVTQYNNYPFNSMCYMNGGLVGAKPDGIYSLSGTMDGSGIIPWKIRLEKFDLAVKDYKSQEYKHKMRYAWITGEINGDIVLTLEDYVGNRYDYKVETVTGSAHELKVKVGKGIKSRYISIELSPSDAGAALVLDHISLYGQTTDKPR